MEQKANEKENRRSKHIKEMTTAGETRKEWWDDLMRKGTCCVK